MKHLSDEQILGLAETVLREAPFSPLQRRDMLHIANCEECYRLLMCTMAVMDTTAHMEYTLPPKKHPSDSGVVIQLVVLDMAAMLKQLDANAGEWIFDAPLSATTRSSGAEEVTIEKLEDIDNPGTFVAYDPLKKVLEIQLNCQQFETIPKVWLKEASGNLRKIHLNQDGMYYWAQIPGLEPGTYEIILEK